MLISVKTESNQHSPEDFNRYQGLPMYYSKCPEYNPKLLNVQNTRNIWQLLREKTLNRSKAWANPDQEQTFCKQANGKNVFGCMGHTVCVTATRLCHCSTEQKQSQTVCGWMSMAVFQQISIFGKWNFNFVKFSHHKIQAFKNFPPTI